MLLDHIERIRNAETPVRKEIEKCGTLKISAVETTPIVWKGRLLRFEWLRSAEWDSVHKQREQGSYIFFDMETEEAVGEEFGFDHAFGCCYEEDGIMYAYGVRGSGGGTNVIDMFWSKDLKQWEMREAIVIPRNLSIFNTSVCRGADGKYAIAIEICGPEELVGPGFKSIFALSDDLFNWELLPIESHIYRKETYSACPSIRYFDGFYYMVYLDVLPFSRYVTYIVRSRDLLQWEVGVRNPFMFFDSNDKKVIHPELFTEQELHFIENAVDCNNSDVDFCEYNGKTIILYSWGNQHGKEFLAMATYDGGLEELLKSYFD